ncbi:ras-like protein isoform X2 [Macrotis lagotis]|uniref:ras-like protein isoform X2 n=1 Tax=Macrotis lagotis TaxID=92651 RepID=UPI003D68F3AF
MPGLGAMRPPRPRAPLATMWQLQDPAFQASLGGPSHGAHPPGPTLPGQACTWPRGPASPGGAGLRGGGGGLPGGQGAWARRFWPRELWGEMQAAAESACQDCPPFLSDPLPSGPPRRLSDQLRGLQNRVISWAMAQYKLVVMGSSEVGKSALILQLVNNSLVSEHDPTLGDLYHTHLVVDGEPCQLEILDATVRDDCPSQWWPFMCWGEGFLCVYAVDDIKSFVDADILWKELWRVKGSDHIPFVLVANKNDLVERQVTWALGKTAAKGFRVPFIEISAHDRQSVEEAFQELVWEIRKVQQSLTMAEQDEECRAKRCKIL